MTFSLPTLMPSTNFAGQVFYLQTQVDLTKAKQAVQEDARKSFAWPKDLPPEIAAENLKLVYLAYWRVSGEGSGQWSAVVGESKRSANGVASATVSDHLVENYGPGKGEPEKFQLLGKRDYHSTVLAAGTTPLSVIMPAGSTYNDGLKVAEATIKDAVSKDGFASAKSMGSVDNYNLAYLSYRNVSFSTLLYPVYIGEFTHKGKGYCAKVDGITGHTTIDVPPTLLSGVLWLVFFVLTVGLFIAAGVGAFSNTPALCFGAFGGMAVLTGIAFAAAKIQEWQKSKRRK